MTHTPAPWKFTRNFIADGDSDVLLLSVTIPNEKPIHFGDGYYSTASNAHEANARLIAAAPELLEALQAYQAHYDAMETYPHSASHPYEIAKAAIAKATELSGKFLWLNPIPESN